VRRKEYGSRVWFKKRRTKEKWRKEREKERKSNLPIHPVANYPLIASNGPKLMDEIQWLKKNSWYHPIIVKKQNRFIIILINPPFFIIRKMK
jgi:hypothetical protein